MKRALCITILLAMSGSIARATEFRATLAVDDDPPARVYPYRSAELTLHTPQGIPQATAVRLRAHSGGPTMSFPVVLLAGASTKVRVALPAIQSQQTYQVELCGSDAPDATVLATCHADIHWPAKLVVREAFFAPDAYSPCVGQQPIWSGGVRRNLFLAAALFVLTLSGTLLIPWRWAKAATVAVLIVAAGILAGGYMSSLPVIDIRTLPGGDLFLATRRTVQVATDQSSLQPDDIRRLRTTYPLYNTMWQWRHDSLHIFWNRRMQLELAPETIRLFRPLPTPE